ncbi:MAG: tetratricopeptide repeat protein [bacterium]|nr:tetratricopeptide repeat protein [bacterium]
MTVFVPKEVISLYSKNNSVGKISGSILFLDIKGFTSMTEKLMKAGKRGAEHLSKITNSFFNDVIDEIYKSGGFITTFAGDAFTAVFPNELSENSIAAALKIKKIVSSKKSFVTPQGEFVLSVKMSIVSGDISFFFIGKEKKIFLLRGDCLKNIGKMQTVCAENEIICDAETKKRFKQSRFSKTGDSYRLLSSSNRIKRPKADKKRAMEDDFLVNPIYGSKFKGEFRNITSLFLSFRMPSNIKKSVQFIETLLTVSEKYECFVNLIEHSDKGLLCYVIFGAPKAHENDLVNAALFASEMSKTFEKRVRAGISYGIAYFGRIGSSKRHAYTAVSSVVNLGARIMMKAKWGEILSNKNFADRVSSSAKIISVGSYSLKGIEGKTEIFRIKNVKVGKTSEYSNRFVGREGESSEILKAVENMNENMGIFFIFGEAGIGKSRLLTETLKSKKEDSEIYTLQSEEIAKTSIEPFREYAKRSLLNNESAEQNDSENLFEKTFEKIADDAERERTGIAAELKRTKIFLKNFLSLENSIEKVYDPKAIFENTLIGIKELIKVKSLKKPQIIILDDAQWLDEQSVKFIPQLLTNVKEYPFILFVIARDEEKMKQMAGRAAKTGQINLSHLTESSVKSMLENMLKGPITKSLLDFILSKSEGNPFFTEQLTMYLLENDAIKYEPSGFELDKRNVEIFSGINSVIMARIDRLSSELKNIVQHASVLGKEFETEVLSRMLKGKNIEEKLTEGVTHNIWSVASEIKYIFSHSLLKDAAYEMQLSDRLKKLHASAASIIEEKHRDDPRHFSDLAFHYERSGNREKSVEYIRKAAEWAKQSYRENDALSLYSKLEELVADAKEKLEIGLKKAHTLFYLSEYKKAMGYINLKLEGIEDKKSIIYAKYLSALIENLIRTGDDESAMKFCRETIEIFGINNAKKDEIRAVKTLGRCYYNKNDYDEAFKLYEESMRMAKEAKLEDLEYEIMGAIALYYFEKSEYEKGIELLERKIEYNRKMNMKREMCYAMGNLGLMVWKKGDLNRAMSIFSEILEVAKEHGDRYSYTASLSNIGMINYYLYKYEEALKCYEEAYAVNEELGNKYFMAINLGNIGNVYSAYGEFDTAEEYYKIAVTMFEEINNPWCVRLSYQELAELCYNRKDYDKMKEYADKSFELAERMKVPEGIAATLSLYAEYYYDIEDYENLGKTLAKLKEASEKEGTEKYSFYYKLYSALDVIRKDREEGEKILLKLIEEEKDDKLKSRISHSLYKSSQKEEHRNLSLKITEEAVKENPSFELKNRLKELKGDR